MPRTLHIAYPYLNRWNRRAILTPRPSCHHAVDVGNESSGAQGRCPHAPTVSDSVRTPRSFTVSLRSGNDWANGHFQETTCIYESRRNKPGLKSGAVEGLNRRLERVEKALFGKTPIEDDNEPVAIGENEYHPGRATVSNPLESVFSTLATELHKLNQTLNVSNSRGFIPNQADSDVGPRKKRKIVHVEDDEHSPDGTPDRVFDCLPDVVTDEMFEDALDAYFSHVQPWIPIIRECGFRKDIEQLEGRARVKLILQAMAVAALRFLDEDTQGLSLQTIRTETSKLRQTVILNALEGLSVENLQALIIIAYTDISNGDLEKAWPIIGSLTRTVEYLELSVEVEDRHQRPAILPNTAIIAPPKEWVEEEERRRVFWNIFILDRFSAVARGWNTSLTAADVCRRLPICGGKWYENEPALTPYFGIWERSRAKLGNSISLIPAHWPSPSRSTTGDVSEIDTGGSGSRVSRGTTGAVDMSTIGAFAYYVESIESLNQITTYFLQSQPDFSNRQDVSSWLTRFKELDLRLVHWKMHLPQQWKDSGISRETMPGIMDPNMTVANATHNVSMILLHQRIAYPDAELNGIRLPSLCSADTCQSAAIETANITQKYLEGSPPRHTVSPQLGICAFVSARVLLIHCQYYQANLATEFHTLVESLQEMSRRWTGGNPSSTSFFSDLALRLLDLQRHGSQAVSSRYSNSIPFVESYGETPFVTRSYQTPGPQTAGVYGNNLDPKFSAINQQHGRFSALPQSSSPPVTESVAQSVRGHQQWPVQSEEPLPPTNAVSDDLSAISRLLMDNNFLEMDRIISFEDMMSAAGDPGSFM